MNEEDDLNRLIRLRISLEQAFGSGRKECASKVIDDFIYSESEEQAWVNTEPNFTKRIYTPLPTKRRLRVTLRKVTLL